MYNQECASLILNTCDLPINASNNVGTLDQYITNATWNNINMRTLLGDMYDKYDRFALVPVSYQSGPLAAINFGTAADDYLLTLNIAGLPFTNNTYNTGTKTNTSYATFSSVILLQTTTTPPNYNMNNNSVLTFTKNQELVNLNIFYKRMFITAGNNNVAPNVNTTYPHFIVMFNIFGVDKHDRIKDLNSSRLF